MPKSDTATMIELAACGGQFMEIMEAHFNRQYEDEDFKPRQALYDLHSDLVALFEATESKINTQYPTH